MARHAATQAVTATALARAPVAPATATLVVSPRALGPEQPKAKRPRAESTPTAPMPTLVSVGSQSRAQRRLHMDAQLEHPAVAAIKDLPVSEYHVVLKRICEQRASNPTYSAAYKDYVSRIGVLPIKLVDLENYCMDYVAARGYQASSLPARISGIKAIAVVHDDWGLTDKDYGRLGKSMDALQREFPSSRRTAPAVRLDDPTRAALSQWAKVPVRSPIAEPAAGGVVTSATHVPTPPSTRDPGDKWHPLALKQAAALFGVLHNTMARCGDVLDAAAKIRDASEVRRKLFGGSDIDIFEIRLIQSKANKKSADPEFGFVYDDLCVRILRDYLKELRKAVPGLSPDAPLFPAIHQVSGTVDISAGLSHALAKKRMDKLLTIGGVGIPNFNMHGFRRGGRTDLLAQGVPSSTVDKLGRWASNAGDLYDERTGIDIISASSRLLELCGAAGPPAARAADTSPPRGRRR